MQALCSPSPLILWSTVLFCADSGHEPAVGAWDLAFDLQPGVTRQQPVKSVAGEAVTEIQEEALPALHVNLAAACRDGEIAPGLKPARHQTEAGMAIVFVLHKLELAILRRNSGAGQWREHKALLRFGRLPVVLPVVALVDSGIDD